MSIRTQEESKAAAAKLADLIMSGSPEKEQIVELKQELGLFNNERNIRESYPLSDEEETNDGDEEERVGIWTLELINGQEFYIRDSKYVNEYPEWAKVHRLPPKGDKRRICFLGESVARGFLYDPRYTPAEVLEQILNLAPVLPPGVSRGELGAGMEVIDLARNNCTMKVLTRTISSCFALHPDAVVIFAGNNWQMDIVLSDDDCREMIEAMAGKARFKALRKIIEGKYIDLVSNFMQYISGLSRAHHIPFVVIIPEYNLLEWRSSEIERRLLFPGEEASKWFRVRMEAETAMDQDNLERVESLCGEMIAVNETNPYCYELLAQCKLKKNLFKEAVKYLRLAHDTTIFQPAHNAGILAVTQETLLKLAHRYHIPVVDIPKIFNQYEEGMQPGHRLFMDFCHLTAEGIKIAMTHTAKCLLSRLAGRNIPLDESKISEINPDSQTVRNAHFFAAIYNAHWGRSYDVVYYHCLKALEFPGTTAKVMINYSYMASRRIPWILSKDFAELAGTGILSHYYLAQPQGQEMMDLVLVEAMTNALRTVDIDIKEKIDRLRKEQHGFINGKINLLESYYHWTYSIDKLKQTSYYYQGFDPQSRFFLVTGKVPRVSLNLTCRVPIKDAGEAWIKLIVNKKLVAKLPVQEKWGSHVIKIPGEVLIDGINTIVIQWPIINHWPKLKRKKHESLFDFLVRKMRPIYGEIHNFWAFH